MSYKSIDNRLYKGNIYISPSSEKNRICRIVGENEVKYKIDHTTEIIHYDIKYFTKLKHFTLVGNAGDENFKHLTTEEILLNFENLFVEYLI